MADIAHLQRKAYALRKLSLMATTEAGSGHPTSCLSAADIVAALFFYGMKFDPVDFGNPHNDRFILSKGHAAPLFYAAWEQLGALTEKELLQLRTVDSPLEGHPVPRFPYTEAATGALGCGLSIGLGMELASRLHDISYYTYVLLGDSEMTEGSVWEAIELAAYYKTTKLVAIVDFNRLGQSTEVIDDHNAEKHAQRWQGFGWRTICIDGHNMEEIVYALDEVRRPQEKPVAIIARTYKGYGLEGIEDTNGYHGRVIPKEQLPAALTSLKERFKETAHEEQVSPIARYHRPPRPTISFGQPPCTYTKNTKLATRKAFGESMAAYGDKLHTMISLDAEVKNSTYAQTFEQVYPKRFIQCFIAEQNMIGMGVGLEARGFIPVCSTFASFMTRAHDQLRMAAINRTPLRLAGSHAGVSIGQDGPSQMGLEDIAMIRALPKSIVLYPCDAVSTYHLLYRALQYQDGISYLRLTRADTPVIYEPDTAFVIGGFHVIKEHIDDKVCIIAAGVTLYEALKAYEELHKQGIPVTVIDLYSIKPLDVPRLTTYAQRIGKVITVEDHYLQGGLGEAVCYALRNEDCTIDVLAVDKLSRSGTPEELLAYHEIDHTAIIKRVKKLVEK